MILPFSTMLNGKPTYFPEKIIQGLFLNNMIDLYVGKELLKPKQIDKGHIIYPLKFKTDEYFKPKIHTIRVDEKDRWQPGVMIDFFINNRQPNMYRFAPRMECKSTQDIEIVYWHDSKTIKNNLPRYRAVIVDHNKRLNEDDIVALARNDGFENADDFFSYFNENFKGKIIHWTGKRY